MFTQLDRKSFNFNKMDCGNLMSLILKGCRKDGKKGNLILEEKKTKAI